MSPFYVLLSAIALPLFLTAGTLAAIHFSRKSQQASEQKWRDDSLDDWRRERDATIEAERQARALERKQGLVEGSGEEEAAPVRQQRLGG